MSLPFPLSFLALLSLTDQHHSLTIKTLSHGQNPEAPDQHHSLTIKTPSHGQNPEAPENSINTILSRSKPSLTIKTQKHQRTPSTPFSPSRSNPHHLGHMHRSTAPIRQAPISTAPIHKHAPISTAPIHKYARPIPTSSDQARPTSSDHSSQTLIVPISSDLSVFFFFFSKFISV